MGSPLLTKYSLFLTNPEERTDKAELFPHPHFDARGFCHQGRGKNVRMARTDPGNRMPHPMTLFLAW
ncbi:MAG: hypothetical protein QF706_05400 [Roseibacillus sp.]|nr:hypothetical protein [Roseibacillus sp.]